MKKKQRAGTKSNPIPVRFDARELEVLADLCARTGLKKAEIIRRAGRYAFPKFLNRKIDILDLPPVKAAA
jgi:hypothetical protein